MTPADPTTPNAPTAREADDRATERRLGIAARCEFATPGPWYTIEVEECDGAVCITHAHHDLYRVEAEVNITAQVPGFTSAEVSNREVNVGCFLGEEADARFIACARADVEWLLARLKESDAALLAARQEVEATRAALLAIADAQRYWEVSGDDDDETFQEFAARLQSLARTGLANRLRAALAATPEGP